jgi:hypothetical protein
MVSPGYPGRAEPNDRAQAVVFAPFMITLAPTGFDADSFDCNEREWTRPD